MGEMKQMRSSRYFHHPGLYTTRAGIHLFLCMPETRNSEIGVENIVQ